MDSIHPAYLKNNNGSKGKLAGHYFTTPGTKIMSLRQCLPWKFGSNYSSTLNGRWKIYTKKDGKDRHVTGKESAGYKIDPIRDFRYTWTEFLGVPDGHLCQTCFDEAIAENADKAEKVKTTLKGKELEGHHSFLKAKQLRKLKKEGAVVTPIKLLLVAC
ncbi:hypothetical protein TL16_g09029 [Triparma laevis f. inornata]|uniref:Uncharacterized protein n=1 Tax=Triparma laevis f. inornata TaxID=1714386 RepID=A0A9W7B0P1_9STRA|nr:hypothetical protein TL16_g09029 [Triparma laevis f. inornata]